MHHTYMLTIETIQREATAAALTHGAQLAVLFGSYARGTATPRSDVDLFFVEETTDPFLKRVDRYFDGLVDRLGVAVEILVYTPLEFERIRERPFLKRALEEGVVLYESGTLSR